MGRGERIEDHGSLIFVSRLAKMEEKGRKRRILFGRLGEVENEKRRILVRLFAF